MKCSINHIWRSKIKQFHRFLVICFLFVGQSTGLVHAESQTCYKPYEVEAEQGIRIHSELLVIGLNCPNYVTSRGQTLIKSYQDFTRKHNKLIETYENIMIGYYTRTGVYNAESELNNLRTSLANKVALDAAKLKPNVFCKRYSGRLEVANDLNKDSLREWAATLFPGHPVTQPLCF